MASWLDNYQSPNNPQAGTDAPVSWLDEYDEEKRKKKQKLEQEATRTAMQKPPQRNEDGTIPSSFPPPDNSTIPAPAEAPTPQPILKSMEPGAIAPLPLQPSEVAAKKARESAAGYTGQTVPGQALDTFLGEANDQIAVFGHRLSGGLLTKLALGSGAAAGFEDQVERRNAQRSALNQAVAANSSLGEGPANALLGTAQAAGAMAPVAAAAAAAPAYAAGVMGPAAGLAVPSNIAYTAMAVQTYPTQLRKARKAGFSETGSHLYAALQTAAEIFGEVGTGFVGKKFGTKTLERLLDDGNTGGFFNRILGIGLDGVGELGTQVAQDVTDVVSKLDTTALDNTKENREKYLMTTVIGSLLSSAGHLADAATNGASKFGQAVYDFKMDPTEENAEAAGLPEDWTKTQEDRTQIADGIAHAENELAPQWAAEGHPPVERTPVPPVPPVAPETEAKAPEKTPTPETEAAVPEETGAAVPEAALPEETPTPETEATVPEETPTPDSKPPIAEEPPQAPKQPPSASEPLPPGISIENASMVQAAKRLGADTTMYSPARRQDRDVAMAAVRAGLADPVNAKSVAQSIIHSPRQFTALEAAGISVRLNQLEDAFHQTMERIKKAEDAGDKQQVKLEASTLQDLQNEFDVYNEATHLAGTEWGFVGHQRRMQLQADASLTSITARMRNAAGKPLTEKQNAQAADIATEGKQLADDTEAAVNKQQEEISEEFFKEAKKTPIPEEDVQGVVDKIKELLDKGCGLE